MYNEPILHFSLFQAKDTTFLKLVLRWVIQILPQRNSTTILATLLNRSLVRIHHITITTMSQKQDLSSPTLQHLQLLVGTQADLTGKVLSKSFSPPQQLLRSVQLRRTQIYPCWVPWAQAPPVEHFLNLQLLVHLLVAEFMNQSWRMNPVNPQDI